MAFGKTKLEIHKDWREVGHAALNCYTTLCCYRYDKDGSLYNFSENGTRSDFQWSDVAETLGVERPHVSNWKKTLFKEGWVCEINGRFYLVKGFEAELERLGIDYEKYIPEKKKKENSSEDLNPESSEDLNPESSEDLNSGENSSDDLNSDSSDHLNSTENSSNHLNSGGESSDDLNSDSSSHLNSAENEPKKPKCTDPNCSSNLNSSSNGLNFSSRVIGNTEISENKSTASSSSSSQVPRAREGLREPANRLAAAEQSVRGSPSTEKPRVVLTDDEKKMSKDEFLEHMKHRYGERKVEFVRKKMLDFCAKPEVKARPTGRLLKQMLETEEEEILFDEHDGTKLQGNGVGTRHAGLNDHLRPAITISELYEDDA